MSQIAQEINQQLRAIQRRLRQPVESGLTGPQRSVLEAVVRSGGLNLKDASLQVGLAHSTVSGIVDRLEKQGLVERHSGQPDRRVTRIVASKTFPALPAHPLVEALRRARPSERKAILDGLRTLHRVL